MRRRTRRRLVLGYEVWRGTRILTRIGQLGQLALRETYAATYVVCYVQSAHLITYRLRATKVRIIPSGRVGDYTALATAPRWTKIN